MLEVPERHAGHLRQIANPDRRTSVLHLRPPVARGIGGALEHRCLRDHCAGPVTDHQVKVAVVLGDHLCHLRCDLEDVEFEREPGLRQRRRPRQGDELRDRVRLDGVQDRSVLKRLDGSAFLSTLCLRPGNRGWADGESGSAEDQREARDGNGRSLHAARRLTRRLGVANGGPDPYSFSPAMRPSSRSKP
jgi:hypothetical protein